MRIKILKFDVDFLKFCEPNWMLETRSRISMLVKHLSFFLFNFNYDSEMISSWFSDFTEN